MSLQTLPPTLLLFFASFTLSSQINYKLTEFKNTIAERHTATENSKETTQPSATPGFNYLQFLENSFQLERAYLNGTGNAQCYGDLSQAVSFLGDYRSALEYLKLYNGPPDSNQIKFVQTTVNAYKNVEMHDAKAVILDRAKNRRVVMINESHCKPLTRAFIISMLPDLYAIGFRYLAMETLDNGPNGELNRLTTNTGFYTSEPIGGKLIREALQLGFTLVAYEDTGRASTVYQRDSAQAQHLFELATQAPTAKILVIGGYGHIGKNGSAGYIPMGYQFNKLSGIEPLSIDQTFLTEESNGSYPSIFYNALEARFPVKKPSILMKDGHPLHYMFSKDDFDLIVFSPRTRFTHDRATWYAVEPELKPRLIKSVPHGTVLVQSYDVTEWTQLKSSAIPLDQTCTISKARNEAYLFLKKGTYEIVFRDANYKILLHKTINVEK